MILTRRVFLLGSASSVLLLGVATARKVGTATASARPLGTFVAIQGDGTVEITCHRSEMGQGIRSSLPVVIADELGADLARVRVVQGDGDPKYGDQNTDGSTSIRNFFDALREAGAVARTMLITVAAKRWKVPARRLVSANSAIHDPVTKLALGFEELAAEASKLLPPPR